MASRAKQKTTMAKLSRERAVQERRVRKQMRKDARRQAAADDRLAAAEPEHALQDEPAGEPGADERPE